MIDDRSQVGRQPITAETTSLAVSNDLLGNKEIIKNASREDF